MRKKFVASAVAATLAIGPAYTVQAATPADNDILYGGAGADWFWFEVGEGVDAIIDWEDGTDKIVVGTSVAGVNVYNYSGQALLEFTDGASNTLVLLSGIETRTFRY